MTFAELLHAVGTLPGIRRVRFTTSHPRDFTRDIVDAIDATPTLCDHVHLPVQSGSTAVLKAMAARVHARVVPRAHRLDQGGEARHQHDIGHHRRLSRRDRGGPRADRDAARRGRLRRDLCLQVLAAAEHAGHRHGRFLAGRGEGCPAAAACSIASARSSASATRGTSAR